MVGKEILYIALGGGVGAVMRYTVSMLMYSIPKVWGLYIGTLLINVVGSMFLGYLFARHSGTMVWYLLAVGFCGGFTTYSTFSLESFVLLRDGQVLTALCYVALSVVLSIVAIWLGMRLAVR